MSKPTMSQQAVSNVVVRNAPAGWTLHLTRYLPRARVLQLVWDRGDDPGGMLESFDIFIGKNTTYESVQKAYPDLPESPVVAAS